MKPSHKPAPFDKPTLSHHFVMANAGSGKTTALVNRLLRILLRRNRPHQIMCLTYTKAAAAEMAERLHKKLAYWSVCDEAAFIEDYQKLENSPPCQEDIDYSKRLFHLVLDSPGGLRLQTIHAFCESLLKRFPVEAKLPPDFQILEDVRANQQLKLAYRHVIRENKDDKAFQDALHIIGVAITGDDVLHLTQQIFSIKQGESVLSQQASQNEKSFKLLKKLLKPDYEDVWQAVCDHKDDLRVVFNCHNQKGTEKQKENAQKLLDILRIIDNVEKPTASDETYYIGQVIDYFLTQKGEERTNFYNSKFTKGDEIYCASLNLMNCLAITLLDDEKKRKTYCLTEAIWKVAFAINERYRKIKQAQAWLDFDDLIGLTDKLLSDHSAAWVHYKLDKGIRHILIDEAQDTNPLQWRIINQLSDPFFDEAQIINQERTLYAVGDVKQSIFSFQGSKPDEFIKAQIAIADKARGAGQNFTPESLIKSYRSSPAILEFVDQAFSEERKAFGLREDIALEHVAHHDDLAGKITIWPPLLGEVNSKATETQSWLDESNEEDGTPKEILAKMIALWVEEKIKDGEIEEVYEGGIRKRPVSAGDINILLRRRNPYQALITRALMDRGIAVMGEDRLQLGNELAVKDLVNFLEFLLAPHDDLRLAILLKSPIGNLPEDELLALCHDRKTHLFECLKQSENQHHKTIYQFLTKALQDVDFIAPYEFLRYILNVPAPWEDQKKDQALTVKQGFIHRLGASVLDSLEEFLSASLHYERFEAPTIRGFLDWFDKFASDVKREFNDKSDEVRIMTIHAAKGLEAPIIILPDTMPIGKRPQKEVIWHVNEKMEGNIPIIAKRKEELPQMFWDSADQIKKDEHAESQRLFYVALTRAKNELLICGADKKTKEDSSIEAWLKRHKESWLAQASQAMQKLDGHHQMPAFLDTHHAPNPSGNELYDHIYECDGAETLEGEEEVIKVIVEHKKEDEIPSPAWLFKTARYEAPPRQPLRPSQAGDDTNNPTETAPTITPSKRNITWESEIYYRSPLDMVSESKSDKGKAFSPRLRGILIHSLLENLPNIAPDLRLDIAHKYLSKKAETIEFSSLDQTTISSIVKDVFSILENDNFKEFYGANSYSEVMVKGKIQTGQAVEMAVGQIDRLVIHAQHIAIIDYKSNQYVPESLDQVPMDYLRQMRIYRDLIRPLYPDKTITTALLWTQSPILMNLDDKILDQITI